MSARMVVLVVAGLSFWIWLAVPACGCTTRAGAYESAMKSDLEILVSQQEIHHHDRGTYATDHSELAFVHSDGVRVLIEAYGAEGWWARAEHTALPGVEGGPAPDCVVYDGRVPSLPRTSERGMAPEQPREVVCDRTEPRRSLKYRIQTWIFDR